MLLSLPRSSVATSQAARLTATAYPALAAPAVLLLLVVAIVRNDHALLSAAVALFAGSALGGALAGLLVRELRPTEKDAPIAFFYWIVALAAPVWALVTIMRELSALWLRSSALADALLPLVDVALVLGSAIIALALLLTVGIGEKTDAPVVLRHRRRAFTDRTFFAVIAVVLIAELVGSVTSTDKIILADGAALGAQLPRLEREAWRYPNHFASQYRYGNALARLRDCSAAVAPLERAVALHAGDGLANLDLADALNCAHLYSQAITPAQTAMRLRPDDSRPYYSLAWALEQTHERARAEEIYRQILLHWPNDAVAMARFALLRYAEGARTSALEQLRKALAIDSTSRWMHITAGELYSNAAMMPEALAQYRALAMSDSAQVWSWIQYASHAYLAGELPEARSAFDHLEVIAPGIVEQWPAWRQMRDASRQGIPSAALPPIAPHDQATEDTTFIRLRRTR